MTACSTKSTSPPARTCLERATAIAQMLLPSERDRHRDELAALPPVAHQILFGLLVVAGSFRGVVKTITAFTVAHSITLALAALDFIRLPSSIIEPLIAASIIYVGIENIFRRNLEKRWRLTFAFGLVHGCGFASVLREAGLGCGSSVALPLVGFNLCVELGQIALAALVLPAVWKLKRHASFQPRWIPACSALVVLAGAGWLAQRLLPAFW